MAIDTPGSSSDRAHEDGMTVDTTEEAEVVGGADVLVVVAAVAVLRSGVVKAASGSFLAKCCVSDP